MVKRNNRGNMRSRKGKDFPLAPDAGSTSYKGIIPVRSAENGITAILREDATFTSGATGNIVSFIDNNPSATDNWTEYSLAWGEYRVLGIRFEYTPIFMVNTATVSTGPLVNCIVHQGSISPPTNYGQVFSSGDARNGHICRKFVREWRMIDVGESSWQSTLSPSATSLALETAAFGLTASTLYGYLFVTYYIQFRNTTT